MGALALPPATRDLEEAWRHLIEYGVARLEGALPDAEVRRARERLVDQARAEREAGVAWRDGGDGSSTAGTGGPNQRVWSLVNKGEAFRSIVLMPGPLELVRRRFHLAFEENGGIYTRDVGDPLLSSFTANIAGPGGVAMDLHSDQMYAPIGTGHPLVVNVLWMLCDFTEANGATRVVPGSHRFEDPVAYLRRRGPSVPAEGTAGTALIFDGRVLHGTGANVTDEHRYGLLGYYCQPFVRQQENFMLSLDPAVRANASPELLALLGYRCWNTLGMVEGTAHGRFAAEEDRVTELSAVRGGKRRRGALESSRPTP
ncbi:MAG: phytanoyl-CoA dioxygenase family protein [Pseudomonadales bacterium]|jgi:hypothetical protein|nr:phytanoyl-CoA dioxygenase family protein [Pseudomonadales bacterium]